MNAERNEPNSDSHSQMQAHIHTDHGTIAAFQSGDEFAFVTLYNRHKEGIFIFCRKVLLDDSAAKDVMQETFLRIYENRDRLLKTDAFRSWIYTIARNQCYNYLRRNKRFVSLEPLPDIRDHVDLTPVGELEKNEQVELVNRLLGMLKLEYREVLVLREYQNLTYDEIALIMRTTVSSVKSRLFKARRKLAQQYASMAVLGDDNRDTVGTGRGKKETTSQGKSLNSRVDD